MPSTLNAWHFYFYYLTFGKNSLMNKRLFAVLLVSAISFGVFRSISYSNRNFAPVAHANGPGENTCAKSGCHSTFPLQENLEDRLSITIDNVEMDANFGYTPGQTYSVVFAIQNAKMRNGFSFTLLNTMGELAGALSTSSNDAQVTNGPNGKKYVGHTNSSGVSSWDFQWTAPSDSQVLTVYSIANLTNNDMDEIGDSVLTKTFSFTAMPDTSMTSIRSRDLEEEIQVISPLSENGVVFNIDINEVKSFNFTIYNAMGELIAERVHLLHTGKQQIKIPFESSKGIYFLQTSSGDKVSIHKFMN